MDMHRYPAGPPHAHHVQQDEPRNARNKPVLWQRVWRDQTAGRSDRQRWTADARENVAEVDRRAVTGIPLEAGDPADSLHQSRDGPRRDDRPTAREATIDGGRVDKRDRR